MQKMSGGASAEINRGMVWLARSGYAARGVAYLIIGIFALLAARGSGETVGTEGAVEQLLRQPFGETLLWIMLTGLCAYVLWRLAQAVKDPEGHGRGPKGLAIRAGLVGSAAAYSLLALFTLSLLDVAPNAGGNGQSDGDLLSGLLGWRYSNVLIYVIAVVPMAVGSAHLIKGWKAKFERYFQASPRAMAWIRPISRVGLIARGIVFLVLAALLVSGGARYQPTDPPGLEDALRALQELPFGMWWLGLVGFGLVAFALYSFAEAIWRRIDVAAVIG